jgi:hypothetical protein
VETVAVMAKYNPFFEKAGMHKIAESKPSKNLTHALEQLNSLSLNSAMLSSADYNETMLRSIGKDTVRAILVELGKREGFLRRRLLGCGEVYPSFDQYTEKISSLDETETAAVLARLSILAQAKVYLFWRKPSETQTSLCSSARRLLQT